MGGLWICLWCVAGSALPNLCNSIWLMGGSEAMSASQRLVGFFLSFDLDLVLPFVTGFSETIGDLSSIGILFTF